MKKLTPGGYPVQNIFYLLANTLAMRFGILHAMAIWIHYGRIYWLHQIALPRATRNFWRKLFWDF